MFFYKAAYKEFFCIFVSRVLKKNLCWKKRLIAQEYVVASGLSPRV